MYVSSTPKFRPQWLRPTAPALPEWLTGDEWFPAGKRAVYSYARSGLLAVLERLDPGLALLPEYLPPGVIACFVDRGFDVEFYGVGADLQLPGPAVGATIHSARPEVVLVVHYFGFEADDFDTVVESAREVGSFVIEDVARGLFTRNPEGRPLGSTGNAAIYSLRKVLPVPHGGVVVARGLELRAPDDPLPERRDWIESLGAFGARLLGWAPPNGTLKSNDGLRHFDYDEVDVEQPSGLWPPRAVGHLSRIGLQRTAPESVRSERRSRYELAFEPLSTTPGIRVLSPEIEAGTCPYGVVVAADGGPQSVDRVLRALRRRGLPVEWFRWPTGIDPGQLAAFPGVIPLRFSTFVVPTHPQIPLAAVRSTIETIRETTVR